MRQSVFFILLSVLSCQAADPTEPSIQVHAGRAVVRGVVKENVKDCYRDGTCHLVLAGESVRVELHYHHGEYPPCANQESIKTGLTIRPGDRIEASGPHSLAGQTHIVDLCCPDCSLRYYRGKP